MEGFTRSISDKIISKTTSTNINTIKRMIFTYIDVNSDVLSETGLYKLVFSEIEQMKLFKLYGLTPKDIKDFVTKSEYIDKKWAIGANPYNLLIGSIITYLLITETTTNKNREMVNLLTLYLMLKLYPSRFHNFFKHGVIREVMEYTANNLSYKFSLKTEGGLLNTFKSMVNPLIDNHLERLKTATDKTLVDFINDTHNRINSLVKKVAHEYYENHKSGKYLNNQKDEETEDKKITADNIQFIINRATNKISGLLSVNGPEDKYIKTSASYGQISYSSLLVAVTQLYQKKKENIPKIIELIISVYAILSPQMTERELHSKKFLLESLKIYKKNNTNDKKIIEIKNILDEWLKECSTFYLKCNREATLNNFKRALYIYFLFIIMDYSAR